MIEWNPLAPDKPTLMEFNPLAGLGQGEVVAQPERDRVLLPFATDRSQEEVDTAIQQGQGGTLREEARQSAIQNQWTRVERRLDQAATQAMMPEQAIIELTDLISQNTLVGRFVDPVVMATILRSDNELARNMYLDRFQRVLLLSDFIAGKVQNMEDEGFLAKAIDFIDSMVAVPIASNIFANRRADFAGQITRLLDSELTDEEFVASLEAMFTEVGDQGWLTDENSFFIQDLIALIPEGGEGTGATTQRLFASLDTVLGALGLAGTVRAGVTRGAVASMAEVASDPIALVARTGGEVSAVRDGIAAAARVDLPSNPINPVNRSPSLVTPASRRPTYMSAPEHQAMREIEDVHPYLQRVLSQQAGQAIDDDLLVTARQQRVEELRASGRMEVIDTDLWADLNENVFVREVLGTTKGADFRGLANAQALANRVGGEVVQVGEGRFRVHLDIPVPLQPNGGNTVADLMFYAKTDVEQLGEGLSARYFSPRAQTTERLDAILKQSEAGRDKLTTLAMDTFKAADRRATRRERIAVERFRADLAGGSNSWRREPMTPDEFKTEFQKVNGRAPTPNEIDYNTAIQQASDAAYFLVSDIPYKDAVNRGVRVIKHGNYEAKVIQVDGLPANQRVYDLDKGGVMPASSVNGQIFSMADEFFEAPGGGLYQYIAARSPKTRRIYHTDVLGYRPAGSRYYVPNETKFFVKQESVLTLDDGADVAASPKTFMAVKTQEEAIKASDEITNIQAAIRIRLPESLQDLDLGDAVRALKSDDDLNRVILANNGWNHSIQNAEDFVDFFNASNLDLLKKIDWAADGQLLGEGRRLLPGLPAGRTMRDSFMVRSNRHTRGKRDVPLMSYGGEVNRTMPAILSVKRSLVASIAKRTEASYVTAATSGLIKEIASRPKALLNPAMLQELRGLTLKAKLHRLTEGNVFANTTEGRRLKLEAEKILFRIDHQSWIQENLGRLKDWLSDTLYSKIGSNRASRWLDNYSGDPFGAAQGLTFDYYLGMLAPDQYLVQASQIFNITFLRPATGPLGAAAVLPVRFLVRNGKDSVLHSWAPRLAPVLGLQPAQFIEMVNMLKQNGRLITNMSLAELNADGVFTGGFNRARDATRFFFKEGELTARINAHVTAYLEFTKKFPGVPASSQQGRRWIMAEQDKLTQYMTTASRSPWQRLPFAQFLSYQWRMFEAVTSGAMGGKASYSLAEKTRMMAGMTAMYGLAGVPAAGVIFDRIYQNHGVELPQDYYTGLRYGMLDLILSGVMGTDTAMSNRLAWGSGITETIRNTLSGSLLEVLAGPSGGVVTDTWSHLMNLVRDISIATNDWGAGAELLKMDALLLVRQVTSVNMAHNAYTAFVLGQYYNRTGTGVIDDEVDQYERWALAFNIPLQDTVERNQVESRIYRDTQFEKWLGRRIEQMIVQSIRLAEADDFEGADALRRSVATLLNATRLDNPLMADRIFSYMPTDFNSLLDQAFVRAAQRDIQTREEFN